MQRGRASLAVDAECRDLPKRAAPCTLHIGLGIARVEQQIDTLACLEICLGLFVSVNLLRIDNFEHVVQSLYAVYSNAFGIFFEY